VFDVLALEEALARLELLSTRMAKVVELRAFGGMTVVECAAELGVSRGTIDKEWRAARAWLQNALA
jgi:RNA polymerase sigma factor (sigma-70 family)